MNDLEFILAMILGAALSIPCSAYVINEIYKNKFEDFCKNINSLMEAQRAETDNLEKQFLDLLNTIIKRAANVKEK